jgi:DNA-binding transcriptional regulator YiaG
MKKGSHKQKPNKISGALHSAASALHKAGALDKTTMRGFDARLRCAAS